MGDEVRTDNEAFEVYLRTAQGDTYHKPLREGLKEFLDPENGYRLSINIEGVVITLRTAWDMDTIRQLDQHLEQQSVECVATIRGL